MGWSRLAVAIPVSMTGARSTTSTSHSWHQAHRVLLNKQAEARQGPFTKAPHSVRHAPRLAVSDRLWSRSLPVRLFMTRSLAVACRGTHCCTV